MRKIITRFAPSPTGFLHIGGIRTALYNYMLAKKYGGKFYVRIEDTDNLRFEPEAEKYIADSLEWFGIRPDDAPWYDRYTVNSPEKTASWIKGSLRQSERDYREHVSKMIEIGLAYYAFDTPEYISNAKKRYGWIDDKNQDRTDFIYNSRFRGEMINSLTMNDAQVNAMLKGPYVVRLKTPENRKFKVNDIIRGEIEYDTNVMDDKILLKTDGTPTYHLANTCDDHDMGTTHVIRGEEWLPSMGHHYLIYEGMGWEIPEFAHLPLILNPNGKGKISKRSALSLGLPVTPFTAVIQGKSNLGFKELGYDPSALLNFLALLGWNPKTEQEIMTMDEMISLFKLEDVHLGGARFDLEKAKYFNSQYIQKIIPNSTLVKIADIEESYTQVEKEMITDLAKVRSVLFPDIRKISSIFRKTTHSIPKAKMTIVESAIIREMLNSVIDIAKDDWNSSNIEKIIEHSIDVANRLLTPGNEIEAKSFLPVSKKQAMPLLRNVVCFGVPGPGVIDTMYIIGRDETAYRLLNSLLK